MEDDQGQLELYEAQAWPQTCSLSLLAPVVETERQVRCPIVVALLLDPCPVWPP